MSGREKRFMRDVNHCVSKKVDARYTSQRYSRCGNTNKANRQKSSFHCRSCHFEAHSDINSGLNI